MANGWQGLFLLCWFSFLLLTGLTFFTKGFLLSRQVIKTNSTCGEANPVTRHLHQLGLIEDKTFVRVFGEVGSQSAGCWLPKRFSKAVIIIIDGLRYDFARFNDSISQDEAPPFINKLTVLDRLLRERPDNAALFKFVADPPTTTMQRIKALITGSLPTFVDVGDNFASFEIGEDNLVDQLGWAGGGGGGRTVFMGDDTWTGLLPGRFVRSLPFPSFDVRDLHTVDNGIVEHLVPEMLGKQGAGWDVIVAHFLGVDHCGHTYGPYHSAMADKLKQMNDVLRSVVEAMDEDTVLFVMGDHGMTNTGDHGGDSTDEVDSALFVYSPAKLRRGQVSHGHSVNQIDLVPTISLLLGLAIPYGNLGTVVPDFFVAVNADNSSRGRDEYMVLDQYYRSLAAYVNLKQVDSYLHAYRSISHDLQFADERLAWLDHLANTTATEWTSWLADPTRAVQRLALIERNCRNYLDTVRDLCRQVWAQFHVPTIAAGIAITIAAIVASATFATLQSPLTVLSSRHAFALFACSCSGLLVIAHLHFPLVVQLRGHELTILLILAFSTLLSFTIRFLRRYKADQQSAGVETQSTNLLVGNWPALLATLLIVISPFSNSYVVSEDALVSFVLVAFLWREMASARSPRTTNQSSSEPRRKNNRGETGVSRGKVTGCVAALVVSVCVRILVNFWRCREEQWWCEASDIQRPLAALPTLTPGQSSYKSWRLFACVTSVVAVVLAARWLIRKAGNANGYLPATLCACYGPVLVGLGVTCFWSMQALPGAVVAQAFPRYGVVLPNVVFAAAAFVGVVVFWWPLCIFCADRDSQGEDIGPVASTDKGLLLQHVYRHVKLNWKRHLVTTAVGGGTVGAPSRAQPTPQQPLRVFGLASVFSAPLLALTNVLLLVLTMLGRDGFALAQMLLVASTAALLYILAYCKTQKPGDKGNMLRVPWIWVILWSLLSAVGFYATGHQQTFPTLHWEVGLIGSDGQLATNLIPAVKILLSTFAAPVILAFSLPMLLLWPLTSSVLFNRQTSFPIDGEEDSTKGEFFFYDSPHFFPSLVWLVCKFLAFQGLKVLSAMLAATWHRRHLMVWKIFAPKFIFEGVQLSVVIPFALMGYLLMMSIHSALRRWFSKLSETDKRLV